jgi:hypothetical protein
MPPEEESDMIKVVVLGDIDDMKCTGGINDLYNALNKLILKKQEQQFKRIKRIFFILLRQIVV